MHVTVVLGLHEMICIIIGIDFNETVTPIFITPEESSAQLLITFNDDDLAEPSERYSIRVTASVVGISNTQMLDSILTILDNEGISFFMM